MNRLRNNIMTPGILVLVTLIVTVFLASCGSDDPVAPVVTNHAPDAPAIDTGAGSPADGAVGIALAPRLSWTCTDPDGDPMTYAVHFGTSATPPEVSASQTALSFTPPALANDTEYFWQIVASDGAKAATDSPIWSFTTVAANVPETISTPGVTGPLTGETGVDLIFNGTGATSSQAHSLEYRFNTDGSLGSWGVATSTTASWGVAGTYSIMTQARCAEHPTVESAWSAAHSVTITAVPTETISTPATPTGPADGEIDVDLTFTTTGAVSSDGHTLQYYFRWDDGNYSDWSTALFATHSWADFGTYEVTVIARCQDHPTVISQQAAVVTLVIAPPGETVATPVLLGQDFAGVGVLSNWFAANSAWSNLSHETEITFDWGDGNVRPWATSSTAKYTWTAPGTYQVRAQARCVEHPDVISAWSEVHEVIVTDGVEIVTVPGGLIAAVAENPIAGQESLFDFETGSTSNYGHFVEYEYDWGDGEYSVWGNYTYWTPHAWAASGQYDVRIRARCRDHTDIISDWSAPLSVTVAESISRPGRPDGPATAVVGDEVTFSTTVCTSSDGHPIEYSFIVVRSGSTVVQSPWDASPTQTFIVTRNGGQGVYAFARCADHPEHVSQASLDAYITVSYP